MLVIASMTGLGPFAIDMYLPGFSAIERDLGEQGVEGTMAAYLVGIAIGQLIYGPISDRFGRKPPLYVGLALYIVASFGCALAASMSMLILFRIVQAFGACAGLVIGRAIVRDRCEPHEAARVFSTLMLIVALGPMLAPSLGGWVVTTLGWRAVFWFLCVLGTAVLIGMHAKLTESRDPAHIVPLGLVNVSRTYARLLSDANLVGYSLAGGFGMGALFVYVTGAATVMTEGYGLTPQQFGWLIASNGLAFMAASRLNIQSLHTRTPDEIVARAIKWPLLFGLTMLAATLLPRIPLPMMMALQLAFFVSVGRVNPNLSALALALHGRKAGAASSIVGSLQSGISVIAAMTVATFSDGTIRRLASMMTVGVGLSWLSYAIASRGSKAGGRGLEAGGTDETIDG